MISLPKKLILLLLLIFFIFSGYTLYAIRYTLPVHAQSSDDLEKELRDKQQQIKELEDKLSQTREQEKSLNSQLKYIDGQTQLTELKIAQTQFQLTKLEKEITDLGNRITRLSQTVDSISEVLLNRIVKTYKYSNYSSLDLIFSSKSFSDLLEKIKYVQVAQANDKKVLYQLQATKATYNDQKQDKQTRQVEQEKLKKDLEKYQIQLTDQKKAKQDLLRITQNDEVKFQQLITKLRADTESIGRALANKGIKLGEVKRGERIASVGNSGCSTGAHLHFEVITPARVNDGRIVDDNGNPIGWGLDHRVDPKPYLDSGKLASPTANYPNGDCSQDPNATCYNGDITTRFKQFYFVLRDSGSYHTGIDIANSYGSSIYAADNGTAYATQDSQACARTGTVGKGVYVDHHNGIVTLYWHIP